MDRGLFETEHDDFRDSVRTFVARELRPRHEQFIEQRALDREVWRLAGKQGLLGLEVPERFDGSEAGDYRFNAVLGEELSSLSAAVASCLGIHFDVVAPYLVELTTDEQKHRWLPGFCSGELVTAIAMTEPPGDRISRR